MSFVLPLGCRPKADGEDDAGTSPSRPAEVASAPHAEESTEPVRVIYPSAPGSFAEVAREAAPAVVALRSTREVVGGPGDDVAGIDDKFALGTGFIIDSTGYVLTNDHVIANASKINAVLSGGEELPAAVVGRDPRLDIALLRLEGAGRLTALPLGDSDALRVGEWVVAMGNPFGLGATLSAGVVSMKDRGDAAGLAGPKPSYYLTYLHTDVAIHSGNSGGPLLNSAGEVVGIAVAVERRGAPIGYAVPLNRVRQILPQLKTDGVVQRAWLGVFIRPVTEELARRLHLEAVQGAFVSDVVGGSPAERAGVRRGDVILEYDQRTIDDRSLPWIASTTGVGRHIPVIVWRNAQRVTLDLLSERMPD